MKILLATLLAIALPLASSRAVGAQASAGYTTVYAPAPAPAQVIDDAWSRLQDSLKSKNIDKRIAAISALSLLGGNSRAEQLVQTAMNDPEPDVRLAAIVAAGQMEKDPGTRGAFRKTLHNLLNSDDPKVSFIAATTLWADHDASGQNILIATAEGERASDYSFWKRSEQNANRTLHSPEALAKIAVTQGISMLVPPVGMGMGAYGYLKGAPGASPQVTAIEQLGNQLTPEVQHALIVASRTKDTGARIAAAESLARFSGPDVRNALYPLTMDERLQVRLTASAAYIRTGDEGARHHLWHHEPK